VRVPAVLMFLAMVAALVGIFATAVGSQTAEPDENLLALSCDYAKALGAANGFAVTSCRRVSEDIEGNRAVERISLRVSGQDRQNLTLFWQRSLWSSPVIASP
jgi:hypothetical protein